MLGLRKHVLVRLVHVPQTTGAASKHPTGPGSSLNVTTRSVSAWISQSKSVIVRRSWGGRIVGERGAFNVAQLKYSSLVSMETTQGICFFSLKRGSSDQDSKLVATM